MHSRLAVAYESFVRCLFKLHSIELLTLLSRLVRSTEGHLSNPGRFDAF